jgi:hypothetical protein
MTDLEPVEPGAVLPRGARIDLPPERWPTAGSSSRRAIVTSGIRALTSRGPVLSVSALTVTAVVAAKVAGLAAPHGRVEQSAGRCPRSSAASRERRLRT